MHEGVRRSGPEFVRWVGLEFVHPLGPGFVPVGMGVWVLVEGVLGFGCGGGGRWF